MKAVTSFVLIPLSFTHRLAKSCLTGPSISHLYNDTISEDERGIILQPKKSLLSHNKDLWQKKSNSTFDVATGSYDGAETCELVGCYLLSKL